MFMLILKVKNIMKSLLKLDKVSIYQLIKNIEFNSILVALIL